MNNAQQTTSQLCLTCQLYFGNPANDNLCSSCFKKRMQANSTNAPNAMAAQQQQLPKTDLTQAVNNYFAPAEKPAVAEIMQEEHSAHAEEPAKPSQDDHSRCWNCKKKVNLLGVKCKCDFTFCNKHRMPEDHSCQYDHATFGRDMIKQNNPLVQKAKLEKI